MNEKQRAEVIEIIEEQLGLFKGEAAPDRTLAGLGMDSLDGVELLMEIEDHFEISISDDRAEQAVHVQDVIDLVAEYIAA